MNTFQILAIGFVIVSIISPKFSIASHGSPLVVEERRQQGEFTRSRNGPPTPQPWPLQFHATLLQNRTNSLALVDLYYDFPGQRNLNIIRSQQGVRGTLYDIEYGNKTSFYFDREKGGCRTISFPVGILRPDWLQEAKYLGEQQIDNMTTFVYTKADFILYYESTLTRQPVRWVFLTSNGQFDVMTWEVGKQAPEYEYQAPESCFQNMMMSAGKLGSELIEKFIYQ